MSPPCPTGCTCRRHTRPRPKCKPGCSCNKHKPPPAEIRQRISESQRGRPHSPQHNARVAEALTGRKLSAEHVAAMSTHGRTSHPHYQRWVAMMARCYRTHHPSYPHYGGRGITVYEPWHDVATFCAWVDENLGPRLPRQSIDRIHNDRGYEPGNVQWADQTHQVANRRPHTLKERVCVVCGATFQAPRVDAKYCSERCHSSAARARAKARA